MDLVIEMGAVTGQPGKCGYNVEGYGLPNSLRGDAARMKSLGAEPEYSQWTNRSTSVMFSIGMVRKLVAGCQSASWPPTSPES